MTTLENAVQLRRRLRRIGLSEPLIRAAWPTWWSDAADESASARTELRFSLARRLGLDPRSLLEDATEPRFVWSENSRFKNLLDESALARAALTSFGRSLAALLLPASPPGRSIEGLTASDLRQSLLGKRQPFIRLIDILSLCWGVGIPVVHLRVFPWPQKRMAAMTVRIRSRAAVLIGKDSEYPAHVAFYLAHEIAHIALQHIPDNEILVDLDDSTAGMSSSDDEETAADKYALEVLTGSQEPVVLPRRKGYNAAELARVAKAASADLGIEPGTLALCFGYSTGDWPTANAALPHIYSSGKPVWGEINRLALSELNLGLLPADAIEYVNAVLGTEA